MLDVKRCITIVDKKMKTEIELYCFTTTLILAMCERANLQFQCIQWIQNFIIQETWIHDKYTTKLFERFQMILKRSVKHL